MWFRETAQNTTDKTDAVQENEKPGKEGRRAPQANIANQKTALHEIRNPLSDCYGICNLLL